MANLDEMIKVAGWFKGTDRDWLAIPYEERKNLAFAATGCEVAYATWSAPVNCLHPECLIRRGEKPAIYLTECIMESQRSNWLRYLTDDEFERLKAAFIVEAKRTGIYDPWKMPGGAQGIVYSGLQLGKLRRD